MHPSAVPIVGVGLMSLVACALNRPASGQSPESPPVVVSLARPHLERAAPNSASLDMGSLVQVELYGTGFTASDNAIAFGPLSAGTVASADGRTLRFIVPSQYPARGEVPPMVVSPGDYAVTVKNSNGISDTLVFTVRSGAR